ncbi:hypothetical protein CcaverHIS002_0112210 [Cutaneotrichosporon cavernicola]|uniref:ER membrane protein complex subunit 1 n=1 Tax=Cutaneotrichosporon cavernicola TaxID=279322 RepID=A0AA48KZD0_9TREE|nr:uncharacterized protein CcaverHIS019_0112090 [Cutaneotrichosporon cavernicola]BEI80692.1 hypothetical protein CcaverHIS002_0112210 [Cutaneotrichosporon cavernicola]BEI88491.1 hypothetical protein CcaverHIS019_0112090 [Cutaneotrichosporon cavernicola]BEI96264.1 hypothetical protein CcaverHIS631_0112130 [Cutaneotrichosporon cavernicola]BEJ04036.1 hypothetical protein CcaverHIS641_0112110 [Cutaneotrichosporon cavernicola]
MLPILLALLSLLSAALALQSDLAGVADWHTALIGVPHLTPSPPTFIPIDGAHATVMVTEEDLVAVLNGNGSLRWRQEVPDVLSFQVHNDGLIVLSGALGTNARLYDLENGRLRWEVACGDASAKLDWRLPEGTRGVGADVAFHNEHLFVLSEGRRITKIRLSDGSSPWSWEFPGDGSANLFKQIVVNGDEVNVLGVLSSLTVPTLTHLTFNAESIMPISEMSHVPAGLGDATNGYLLLPRGEVKEPGLRGCWTEDSRYRCTDLYGDGTVNIRIKDHIAGTGRRYERMIDVGLREHGFMLGLLKSGAVLVIEVGDGGNVVAEFDRSRQNRNGMPVHSGAYHDGVYTFTRVYYSYDDKGWKVQIISVRDGVVEQTEDSVPLDPKHGIPRSCASNPDGSVFVTTSTGALQLSRAGQVVFIREEALTDIAGVHFVELGEPETEEALGLMAHESFIGRLTRHAGMLSRLPAYIQHFVQRLSSTADIAAQTPPLSKDKLHRDQFGLQKLVVAISRGGKVYGLDSANGGILWSRNLGFFDQNGPELQVYGTWATRGLGERGNPQIGVVAVRTREDKQVTLGYTVDAFTGDVAGDKEGGYDVPVGRELFTGPPHSAFLTKFIHCCTGNTIVGVVDDKDTLHLFPKCKKVVREIEAAPFFYTILDRELEGTTLRGYTPGAAGEGITFSTEELWSRPFPAQDVLEVSSLHPSPVASFGRALGDKAVLYKYLNPHLLIVTSVSPFTSTGHVYIIDSATGASVHEFDIPHVVGNHVRAAMVENWLVYAWLESATSGATSGGWRLASVEMYEHGAQSVGRSSLASPPSIEAVTQTFILESDVKALTFTTSKYGVTTKDLLYINDAGQVAHIPRRFLDPRRPVGKPTKAEQEDMLVPYSPVIPGTAQQVISHVYRVRGLKSIVASPALLESTTLVLAYGLDLFGSRALQPSGSFDILGTGFAKTSLLLTLGALGAGVAVAAPSVRRKSLTAKWF